MNKNAKIAAEVRAWLSQVMRDRGLTVTDWANAASVARTTIARPLKEGYQFATSYRTLVKLAEAAGVPPPSLSADSDATITTPRFLPVRHEVQAGHWIEQDAYRQDFADPPRPVPPDPRFSGCQQWLERVVGDSIDKLIAPESFVHVVSAIDLGYSPKTDDLVVVERRRDGGHFRERTIKQVVVLPTGDIELWPRSHNPMWTKPIDYSDVAESDPTVEVEISGLVIGAYIGFL